MPGLGDGVGASALVESSVLRGWPAETALPAGALASRLISMAVRESSPRRVTIRASRGDLPEPLLRAVDRLSELQRLPRGWNSHDAKPVSDVAVSHAVEFLTTYLVRDIAGPALVPTVRGGLQIEWHQRGVDIEIEVGPDGSVSWCAEDRQSGRVIEAALAGHEETVREWLRRASGLDS